MPPFMLEAHELRVGDQFDVAWKLRADWAEEQKLRTERNQLIMEKLQAGKTVAIRRSSGWPLYPKVCSNDLCIYVPVNFDDQVQERGIVFCANLVLWKEWHNDSHAWKYWISNLKERVNGYRFINDIYGKLSQFPK